MRESEEVRGKWAAGLTALSFVFIFFGWAFYKGYVDFGGSGAKVVEEQKISSAKNIAAVAVPSPLENSKETLGAAFDEIKSKYSALKESLSSVIVPFVTGIEVYERL